MLFQALEFHNHSDLVQFPPHSRTKKIYLKINPNCNFLHCSLLNTKTELLVAQPETNEFSNVKPPPDETASEF